MLQVPASHWGGLAGWLCSPAALSCWEVQAQAGEWKTKKLKPTKAASNSHGGDGTEVLKKWLLTVNEVNVMHIPPKPFRDREMKMSTERAVGTQRHRIRAPRLSFRESRAWALTKGASRPSWFGSVIKHRPAE